MILSRKLLELWAGDRLAFCHDVFPEDQWPREWQPTVLRSMDSSRFTAVRSCREAGKSRLASYAALHFLFTRPRSLVYCVAPIHRQAESLLIEIRALYAASKLPDIFPDFEALNTELRNTKQPGWRLLGVASDTTANLEGEHGAGGTFVVVDEAKAVPDSVWNSLQGLVSQPDDRVLAISTPSTPSGWFYRAWASEARFWDSAHVIRADEIPRLAGRLERERDRLGEGDSHFQSQIMAEFAASSDEAVLFTLAPLEASTNRTFEPEGSWKKILALDPAGRGMDHSVLSYRHGPVLLRQQAWQGADEMTTVGRTVQAVHEWRPSTLVVDECGLGGPIASRLQEVLGNSGVCVVRWNAGAKAQDSERFANQKSECYFQLRARFETGDIAIPRDPELLAQLLSVRVEVSSTGKTKTVDPADSPDKADSLVLAFAADYRGPAFCTLTAAELGM